MTEGNNNIFLAGNDTLGYLVRPMHKKYSMACIWSHPFTCGSYDRVLDLSHMLPNVHMYAFRVHPLFAYVILSVWYPSVPFQLFLFALLSSYCFTTEIQKFMTYVLTFCLRHPHFTKIWSFLFRISPVSCGFGNIYWRNLWWKISFFVTCYHLMASFLTLAY